MRLRPVTYTPLLIAFLSLTISCQPEGRNSNAPLEETVAVNPAQADLIYAGLRIALLKQDQDRREYLMQTGNAGFEQTHFVQTEDKKGIFHFREIYNIYHDSTMAQLEVYVTEFRFDPDSLNRLYRQDDYRIVLKGDSAFLQEETFSFINPWRKKEVTVAGKSYDIFQIEGYSPLHLQGTLPSPDQPSDYLKFWNPEIGTILIYYGSGDDDQMFELQAAGSLENQDIVADLRRKIVQAFRE